jgi:cyanate lyase
MKQYLILLISFLIQNSLISQEVKNYEFIGTVQLSDKTIITFKLNFKEDLDGFIVGTSLSDIYGADRTLSKIEGKISRDKKTISFKEIENLNTKSRVDIDLFCFIEVNNAKLKKVNGSLYLTDSAIHSLPELTYVGGVLGLRTADIEDLPKLTYVGETFVLTGTPLSKKIVSMSEEERVEFMKRINAKGNILL